MRIMVVPVALLAIGSVVRLVPVSASAATGAQQQETRGNFDVRCRSNFLGETPTITISMTNTGRSVQTVKEASHQKFAFHATGIFGNDSGQRKKDGVYDGTWDFPKEPVKAAAPGEVREWLLPRKREPRFVQLSPGQSTELELDWQLSSDRISASANTA